VYKHKKLYTFFQINEKTYQKPQVRNRWSSSFFYVRKKHQIPSNRMTSTYHHRHRIRNHSSQNSYIYFCTFFNVCSRNHELCHRKTRRWSHTQTQKRNRNRKRPRSRSISTYFCRNRNFTNYLYSDTLFLDIPNCIIIKSKSFNLVSFGRTFRLETRACSGSTTRPSV